MGKHRISRIIGNELPLRDRPGGRLEAYKFILENEPAFRNHSVDKVWIINRVYSQVYLKAIIELLRDNRANYIINPFVGEDYRKCKTRDQKTLYAINANVGRNFALKHNGQSLYHCVFDGECMLRKENFEAIESFIIENRSKYYSVPMRRVRPDGCGELNWKYEEPQLIFRADATLRFDENMVYPTNDKNELLWRLGHSRLHGKQFLLDRTDMCLSTGLVLHIDTGPEDVETDLVRRDEAREAGKDLLLSAIDREFGC